MILNSHEIKSERLWSRGDWWTLIAWLSLCFVLETSWVALYSDVCQSVSLSGIGVTQPNLYLFQYIKAFKPLLTLYHLKPISSNLYWPSTSQYRHILIQYHQVPLLIHHLDRHSSANWIISLFTTHLMSHAQYTWSKNKDFDLFQSVKYIFRCQCLYVLTLYQAFWHFFWCQYFRGKNW